MKKVFGVMGVVLLTVNLISCGQSNNSTEAGVTSTGNEEISLQKSTELLNQGYLKVGDNAFIKREIDNTLSFYTFGESGKKNLLIYLQNAANTDKVGAASVEANGYAKLKDSLASFFDGNLQESNISKSTDKPLNSQAFGCNVNSIGINAGGDGSYAYSSFTGATGDLIYNCYSSRFQLDAGYPRTSKTAYYQGPNSCSGSLCTASSSNWSNVGYNSSPYKCYSGAYVMYKGSFFDPETNTGKSYTCP